MSINTEQIEQLIAAEMTDSEVSVEGQGANYQVSVISDFFDGLNAVKRQQAVYKILNPHIASGDIHAVSMLLRTRAEHASA